MGLMDRDYMHDVKASPSKRGAATLRRGRGSVWKVVVGLILLFLAIWATEWHSLFRNETQQFSPVYWYVDESDAQAPFSIVAPNKPDRVFAVKLADEATGRPVVLFLLRGGEAVNYKVPLGKFYLTISSGTRWYGLEKGFGIFGETRKSTESLHFTKSPNGFNGHTILLDAHFYGNLKTRPLLPFER